jgi:uncharacterized protein YqhQ
MTTVGGQAVLEGVMMRGPSNWSVAVRKPDGDIAHVNQPISSPMARNRIFRLPVVRGVIALGESLAIGFRALAISANYAAQEEKEGETLEEGEPPTELTRAQLIFAFAIFVFAFFGRPAWYWLIATRILLLPVIAGIAYELIRFAGKHTGNRVLMTILAPGLWLQRLTTREPTLDQIEVSIRALKEVLALEGREPAEGRRVEVMA